MKANLHGQHGDHVNFSKSNSTVGGVRVETNLSGTSTIIAQFFLQMHNKKMFDIENEGQISDAAQHSHPFDCKYTTSYLMAIVVFVLSLTVYDNIDNER